MGLKHKFGKAILNRLSINRRAFDIVRFEFNAWKNRFRNRLSPAYRSKISSLRKERGLSLNVGTGGRGIDGWVNVDAIRSHRDLTFTCDIRQRLPFHDGQFARIFAEHVVEHLDFKQDVPRVFAEFHRVLQPGGRVRIIVPDAERWLQAYTSNDPKEWEALGFRQLPSDMPTPMAMINHVFHQGGEHQFAYDFATMRWALNRGGFERVEKRTFGDSGDPLLALDRSEHSRYSLYVEAIR